MVRRGRRFGYVSLIGLPIKNPSDIVRPPSDDIESPFTNHFSTFHLSPIPSPLTSHQSLLTAATAAERCASKISSLYCLNSSILGCFSITAAFSAAGDLKKILGSGFEMIRISQGESARVFGFYDKEMTKWRSNSGSQYRTTAGVNTKAPQSQLWRLPI